VGVTAALQLSDRMGGFPMARPDRSTKMAYALAGAVIGAVLIRVVVLLKQRAARAVEREQMAARLEQLAL
jgi:hypothetical protein